MHPLRHINVPTIARIAQSRTPNLHEWTRLSYDSFSRQDTSDSNPEKQKDDSSDSQFINPQPSPPPHPQMTRGREYAFIFITCIAQFLSLGALNQTVAPVMVLARHFHIEDYGTLSWFSASFSMSVGAFILPAGMYRKLSLLVIPFAKVVSITACLSTQVY